MHPLHKFSARLLFVTIFLTVQPHSALALSKEDTNAFIRELADRTADHLEKDEIEAVYASMSPKLKQAYSHDELTKPSGVMQKAFGHIKSHDFLTTNYGKRGIGDDWIRIVTYLYNVKTDKYPSETYLKVEVTQEDGQYYIAGYSLERVLLGGKPPFLRR